MDCFVFWCLHCVAFSLSICRSSLRMQRTNRNSASIRPRQGAARCHGPSRSPPQTATAQVLSLSLLKTEQLLQSYIKQNKTFFVCFWSSLNSSLIELCLHVHLEKLFIYITKIHTVAPAFTQCIESINFTTGSFVCFTTKVTYCALYL